MQLFNNQKFDNAITKKLYHGEILLFKPSMNFFNEKLHKEKNKHTRFIIISLLFDLLLEDFKQS